MWRITKLIIKAIKEIHKSHKLYKEIYNSQNEINEFERAQLKELLEVQQKWNRERYELQTKLNTQWQKSWNESKALRKQKEKLQTENLDLHIKLTELQELHTEEMEQYSGLRQDLFKASVSKQTTDFQVISVIKVSDSLWYDSSFEVYFLEAGKLGTMRIVLRAGATRDDLIQKVTNCQTKKEILATDERKNIYYD